MYPFYIHTQFPSVTYTETAVRLAGVKRRVKILLCAGKIYRHSDTVDV